MNELLVIDAGNSNVKYGLFKDGVLADSWRHPSSEAATQAEEALAKSTAPIVLSSVVPTVSAIIKAKAGKRQLIELSAASQSLLTGMDETMGSDRVAEAVAAWSLYGDSQKPVILMGFGTATTLLTITAKGNVGGGGICVGITAALEVLHERCALLPLLEMKGQKRELGHDTETHIRNFTFMMFLGGVKEVLAVAQAELKDPAVKVATGGWSQTIQDGEPLFDHIDSDLVLKGAYIIGAKLLTDSPKGDKQPAGDQQTA